MKYSLLIIILFAFQLADAQSTIDKVSKYRSQHEGSILKEYFSRITEAEKCGIWKEN